MARLRRFALLLSLPVLAAAADELTLTAVRHWSLSDITRIALEFNGPFTFRMDQLSNPNRVFFDLKGARPQLSSKGVFIALIKDPRVKQVRVAETSKLVTRIVLDLEDGQFDITTSELSVPDRLVVEVRAKGDLPAAAPTLSSSGVRRVPVVERAARFERNPSDPPLIVSKPTRLNAPPLSLPSATVPAPAPPAKIPYKETVQAVAAVLEPSVGSELSVAAEPVRTAARAAKRNSNGDRSLTRALGLKVRRVVLDPGHGGYDHGSTGPGGLVEKELVLDVTRRLGALVEEYMGSEVIYTRSTDTFIPLEDRTSLANVKKADIFLSIHANSSPIRTASGVETYYLSLTSSRAAMDVAARENASSTQSISDLRELIQKIALRDKVDESREFAAKVQTALTKVNIAGTASKQKQDRGVKKAPFVVLIGASMPSILAEIGFVSNSREEAQLKKPEYRQKLAEALCKGLQQYAESLSHFQVAQRRKGEGTE
ncbi:MAG TPA: N-acetylmuramoyl-L-alanine amidase [Bryobacteraceae bacterium]|nr:N-acetylmuramoyl-L-alanine amidase [Bryobacteraceae bacterium]